MTGITNTRLAAYKADVQAAQQAYSEIMRAARVQVDAGNLPEDVYWRLGGGDLLAETTGLIDAATERFIA